LVIATAGVAEARSPAKSVNNYRVFHKPFKAHGKCLPIKGFGSILPQRGSNSTVALAVDLS
jgi:hypothetical protein